MSGSSSVDRMHGGGIIDQLNVKKEQNKSHKYRLLTYFLEDGRVFS